MKYIISLIVALISITWFSFTDNFPYDWNYDTNNWRDMLIWNNSSTKKIIDKYIPEVENKEHPIAYYISTVINYFLWILAFITFIVIIRWVSMTFIWKSNEGIKKWVQYIKKGIIIIVIIWASWLVSMLIFNIYNSWVK